MSDSDESSGAEEAYKGELDRESVQEEEKEKPPRDVIHVIFPKSLSKEVAARCLSHLGKPPDCSGLQLAYTMIKVNDLSLTNIDAIADFKYLHFVDVSRNYLQGNTLHVLDKLEYLLTLRADNNHLGSPKLPKFPFLQVLALNKNRITAIDGIDHPKLKCLELNYNKLTEAVGLNPFRLRELQTLELRGNSLTSTVGIYCPNLETLILCENLIEEIVGLEKLTKLRMLHLRDNPLSNLDGFSELLAQLTYLNLRSCQIRSLKEIKKLAVLPRLETLVLWDNPVVDVLHANYRLHVLICLPRIKRIDKGVVRRDEHHFADLLSKQLEMRGEFGGEDQSTYPDTGEADDEEED